MCKWQHPERVCESRWCYTEHTVTWHVDNLKSNHKQSKVNDIYEWLQEIYGDPKIAPVKATRGKIHEYLGMMLDYTTPVVVKIDMKSHIKEMI